MTISMVFKNPPYGEVPICAGKDISSFLKQWEQAIKNSKNSINIKLTSTETFEDHFDGGSYVTVEDKDLADLIRSEVLKVGGDPDSLQLVNYNAGGVFEENIQPTVTISYLPFDKTKV